MCLWKHAVAISFLKLSMSAKVENDPCVNLKSAVWRLVSSGRLKFDEEELRKLKKTCRHNLELLQDVRVYLLSLLNEKHSQIRLAAMRLIDVFVDRSTIFCRDIICSLSTIVTSCALDPVLVKLQPSFWTAILILWTRAAVASWSKKYGQFFSEFSLAHRYVEMKQSEVLEQLDDALVKRAEEFITEHRDQLEDSFSKKERATSERERQINSWRALKDRYLHSKEPFARLERKISHLFYEFQGLGKHLTKAASTSAKGSTVESNLKALGIPSSYQLELNMDADEIKQNLDLLLANSGRQEKLVDLFHYYRLATEKWKPRFERWLSKFKGLSVEPGADVPVHAILKWLLAGLDSLQRLQRTWEITGLADGVNSLIKGKPLGGAALVAADDEGLYFNEESDDGEDFEEVTDGVVSKPTRGYGLAADKLTGFPLIGDSSVRAELSTQNSRQVVEGGVESADDVADSSKAEAPELAKAQIVGDVQLSKASGPCSEDLPVPVHLHDQWQQQLREEEDSRRKSLLASAPFVSYDTDLYYWDKTRIKFHDLGAGVGRTHRFYGTSEGDNYISDSALSKLKMRVVSQETAVPSNSLACRAPIGNGRLCERRDYEVCPIHGPIVPRNEQGLAVGDSSTRPAIKKPVDILAPVNPESAWQNISADQDSVRLAAKLKPKSKRRIGPYWVSSDSELVDIFSSSKTAASVTSSRSSSSTASGKSIKKRIVQLAKSQSVARDIEALDELARRDKHINNWSHS